ncbi:glyoxalase/bleomycin resistance /dioxygenase domain protein [Mycobacterium kansasii]|uniref:Glyoxalase/bleomycin resistance /dioxygenase domain protein n=1 Tax=Mycobacterium kansasii TaxID=1768 RepID=A0A1V3XIT9_MYCKA|nr:glyoxalase/bleomycin resistance /dioxygenase domain protein [Mycobacterium kansasii]
MTAVHTGETTRQGGHHAHPSRRAAGRPCWIDLTTSDVDRAQDFYATVFGWTFESAGPSTADTSMPPRTAIRSPD